jgi:hypothetical protein
MPRRAGSTTINARHDHDKIHGRSCGREVVDAILRMCDDEMDGRISLPSFSGIPRQLGQVHLHGSFFVDSTDGMTH